MLSETFDLLDIAPDDIASDEGDRFHSIEIVIGGDTAPAEDDRPEPTLASTPFFVEFDEPTQLDPERAGLIWELVPPPSGRTLRLRSPVASLAFHLLPFLVILIWPLMAVEPPPSIPVQLVFEQPPPPQPPPPPPQPAPKPPPQPPKMQTGRLASVDMGAVKPPNLGRAPDPVPQPSAGEPQPDAAETQTAAPPPPMPKPAPPKEPTVHPPKPSGVHVARHEVTPREAQQSAQYAGPIATRDEYFAHLVELTRRHVDLLPRPLASETHGETVLSIQVQDNGAVQRIAVVQSSGNSELDERVVAMVRAVGHFPPLPQWFQGQVMDMDFRVGFPLALE
jgi:protein TonB